MTTERLLKTCEVADKCRMHVRTVQAWASSAGSSLRRTPGGYWLREGALQLFLKQGNV